jgi:two-component system response regulator PhoP
MTDHQPPPGYSPAPASRICVLEDNDSLRQDILLPALREHGFHVQGVATAAELYRTMLSESFDIVVLPIDLPDGDGFAIARHLRTISDIGIVLLSSRMDRQRQLDALKSGADFYLTKPVDLDLLAATLRNLARRLRSVQHVRDANDQSAPSGRWKLESGGW